MPEPEWKHQARKAMVAMRKDNILRAFCPTCNRDATDDELESEGRCETCQSDFMIELEPVH